MKDIKFIETFSSDETCLLTMLESGIVGLGGAISLTTLSSISPLLLLLIDVFKSSQSNNQYSENANKAMQDDLRILVDSELETAFLNFKLRMQLVKENIDKNELKSA